MSNQSSSLDVNGETFPPPGGRGGLLDGLEGNKNKDWAQQLELRKQKQMDDQRTKSALAMRAELGRMASSGAGRKPELPAVVRKPSGVNLTSGAEQGWRKSELGMDVKILAKGEVLGHWAGEDHGSFGGSEVYLTYVRTRMRVGTPHAAVGGVAQGRVGRDGRLSSLGGQTAGRESSEQVEPQG